MRTYVPLSPLNPTILGIDIRLVLIIVSTLLFFVNLAQANNDSSPLNIIGEKKDGNVVLEVDAIDIAEYEIFIDEKPYEGDFIPNQNKNVHVYNFSEIRNTVFFVNEFNCDGKLITGKFNTIIDFVDYLNEKTDSEWSWDEARGIMYGGNSSEIYNGITITPNNGDGKMLEFPSSSVEIAKNLMIQIPKGEHSIKVRNFVTGHSETKEIIITGEIALK